MRLRTIALVMLCFAILGICLEGKPVRQWLDDTTELPPARYGYEVSRKEQDGQWRFTVVIAPEAAKVLEKATLISLAGKPARELPLPAADASGRKQLEFSIPKENLKGSCLDLDSGPVKYCGPSLANDFVGFRLNLESAGLVVATDNDLRVFARKKDSSFEFRIVLPRPTITISGPSGSVSIISAVLTGPVEGGMMAIPLPIPTSPGLPLPNDPVMTLPAASLENFVVHVVYGHYDGPLHLTKTTTRHLGLGIVAANAEAAVQGPLPDQLQPKQETK